MPTRRDFMALTTAGLAATTLAPAALARLLRQDNDLETRPLRDDSWAIIGQGGNSLLVRTDAGPLLVDTKVAGAAEALRAACVLQGRSAPLLVINTHHHADHTGGNYAFSKGASIIAHVNVRPRLADTLASRIRPALGDRGEALRVEDFDADREVSDKLDLEHGGVDVKVRHYGFGHTDNDVVVYFPRLNILHMGDLLFHEVHPFIDASARATTIGWQKSLAEARKLCDEKTIVIPGHGEITDRTGLAKMSDYFDQLRSIVAEAIRNGRSREEVTALQPEVFKSRGFERLQPLALGVMYDELKAG